MPLALDLVLFARLDAQIFSDEQYVYTQHPPERLRNDVAELWKRTYKPLGAGGMGMVYREECISGEKEGAARAVKVIAKPDLRVVGETNWTRELEAIARFSQTKYERWFARSLGWYDDTESLYIAMELAPQGDLQRCLDRSLISESAARLITRQVVTGLSYMHGLGYTHRDLKPQNILVFEGAPDWHVKIADFGISKRVTGSHTALRTNVGTLGFIAPEVLGISDSDDDDDLDAQSSYTHAVDMWAMGTIAFVLLTRELPFPSNQDYGRGLRRYANGKDVFPSGLLEAKRVSSVGQALIKSLLHADPKQRPTAVMSLQDTWLSYIYSPNPYGK